MELSTLLSSPSRPIPSPFLPTALLPKPSHPFLSIRRGVRQCPLLRPRCASSSDSSSASSSGARFSWQSISRFAESVRNEAAEDIAAAGGFLVRVQGKVMLASVAVARFRNETLPALVAWNEWENWKDFTRWEPKRIGVFILYISILGLSLFKSFTLVTARIEHQSKRELTEAFMEALIPDPSAANVRKLKKGIWRKTIPKGLKMKKFVAGPGGTLVQDTSFVGEDAWDEDTESPSVDLVKIIENDKSLNSQQKENLIGNLENSGSVEALSKELPSQSNWRGRLARWNQILRKDKQDELFDSLNAKYVVDFDMQEVEKSLRKEVVEKMSNAQGGRALWISKRWWLYRPKLPYMYFLDKLDSSEVAAVVFTENLKKVFVTMKEGFPLEYVVDIPLDPHLFETLSSSGAEVDLLQKQQFHYVLKVALVFVPGLLILYLIRETLMLLHITSRRFLYKRQNQLLDMVYAENFILPLENLEDEKAMYKEVILGGDVWDLLDEIMIYMNNPMQYYEKQVSFVRGILLSGPPGTGKTLFARTLSKESGMPFVFASGAEFTDSEKSGAARINEIFSVARRNAPSFVFIDEIDAVAGRHARQDPRRRATFDALITQLDGEKEKTGVDRFSLRQAVIFICATNRPDELDAEFVRPGRIDRRLYIGLPDAKQRVQIFGVHSSGKKIDDNVDFEKLVFRTVGYSGADIRNLVNEAAIMSVRKGHPKIMQQDIVDVLDKQLLEGMGVLLTEEEQQKCEASVSLETRRLLAVHEAGHILLAHIFPCFDWHAFSQLLPGGEETAISVFYPREDMVHQGYTTFGYMKMQMVVAHGGRCAEKIIFGDNITDGGRDDLEKITKIAREMVISPRNPRLGLTALVKHLGMIEQPDNPDGELIKYKWDDSHVIPADMSVEVSELFTRELRRYIDETEEMAMNGLLQNRHILDMVARELLEKSRLTGLEVKEKMKDMSPVMLEDLAEPFQIDLDKDGLLPVNDRLSYKPLDIYPAPFHRC